MDFIRSFKWTTEAELLLEKAVALAQSQGYEEVWPEHLLKVLITEPDFKNGALFKELGLSQTFHITELTRFLFDNKKKGTRGAGDPNPLGVKIERWVQNHTSRLSDMGAKEATLGVYDMLAMLLDSSASSYLKEAGLTRKKLFDAIEHITGKPVDYHNLEHSKKSKYVKEKNSAPSSPSTLELRKKIEYLKGGVYSIEDLLANIGTDISSDDVSEVPTLSPFEKELLTHLINEHKGKVQKTEKHPPVSPENLEHWLHDFDKWRDQFESGLLAPKEFYNKLRASFTQGSDSSESQIARQQADLMHDPLKSFTVNLTQEAKRGKLMPMFGHEKEIAEMIQTLCQKSKCNPLLVGDEGVGKTAAVEGLAYRIATGDVPDILKDHEIYSLDLTALLAGCVWHGMMEERVQGVINAVTEDPKAILFIDEIHTIVGAGVNDKDELGVSNMLKPVLARGGIKCIGSTTYQEFTRRFEKEKALARRFYKIDVMEPSRVDSIKILEEIVPQYKEFHHIDCDDSAVQAAVDLSIRYIPDRKLPDKAIDLLDEAFAMAKINGENAITAESVKKVVSRLAKISLENMDDDEESGLKNLAAKIGAQIFGQEQAIQDVVRAVKKARSGFKNPEKPEASFLFVGSTGVGKTELCKVLAKELNRPFLRYDMSEYQDEHSCYKLIGCERGYRLSEEGGILTNAIHRNPHAIVLFDEIEKAHPVVYNLLLQVLDYGTLTDGYGEKADFRNCLIIMTSNVGVAKAVDYKSVGFGVDEESEAKNRESIIKAEIEKTFSPEFRNRLDKIVMFNTLDKDVAKDVARREVGKIETRILEKNIHLSATDAVINLIAEKGYSREFGGRNIAKKAEELLGDVLIDEILFGQLKNGGDITLDVKDGKVCIGAEGDASSAE